MADVSPAFPRTPGLYIAIPLHELAELLVSWNNEQVLFQSFHQWLLQR
jgi:hypothetical protein